MNYHNLYTCTNVCTAYTQVLCLSFLFFQFTSDYGDLIKKALSHFREHNQLKWYKVILQTLQHQYTGLQEEGEGKVDHRSVEWADLRVRFYLSVLCLLACAVGKCSIKCISNFRVDITLEFK